MRAACSNPITPPLDWVRCGATEVGQALGEAIDVALHDRAEIGIDHGGGHALVFPEFRRDVGRGGNEGVRKLFFDDAPRGLLVRGCDEAVEEADRHRLHAGCTERARCVAHGAFVQCGLDAAIVAQALRNLQTQVARHQHR
jgi:hypothetical protein